jgi:hypothetical protein
MAEFGTVDSENLNSCLSEYWYLWTVTSIGMVLMTCVDAVVTFILLKKFFKTPKIGPKRFMKPTNESKKNFFFV